MNLQVGNVSRLTELDVATNTMLGDEPREPLPRVDGEADVAAHLGTLLAPALAAGRCFVPFSGGRDSSCMLALATSIARRHGFEDPIPVTERYARAPGADEQRYQELVIRHLGLRDWEIVDIDDELQLVGPVATEAMRRHGLLFPAAAHTMIPVLERAAGGTLIMPIGQSDFFSHWRFAKLAEVLAGRRRPRRGDLAEIAFTLAPGPVRRRVVARQIAAWHAPWMRPGLERWFVGAMAARLASAPARFDRAIERQQTYRCYRGAADCLHMLAADFDARVLIPLYEPSTLAVGMAEGGRLGVGDRMNEVLYGEATRAFAARWSGEGLDEELVDPDALRELWRSEPEHQDIRTGLLMQLAWLHDERAIETKERGPMKDDEQQPQYEQPKVTDLGSLVKVTAMPNKFITNSDHSFGSAPIGS